MEQLRTINLQKLKGFVNEQYLNPLKCEISLDKCRTALYFVVGMVAIYLLTILFSAHKYSNISLFLTTILLCVILFGGFTLLMNLHISNYPPTYEYVTIVGGLLLSLVIVLFFKK